MSAWLRVSKTQPVAITAANRSVDVKKADSSTATPVRRLDPGPRHFSEPRLELAHLGPKAAVDSADSKNHGTTATSMVPDGNLPLREQSITLPLRFEPNRGQAHDGSQYIARSGQYEIHFSPLQVEAKFGIEMSKGTAPTVQSLPITLAGGNTESHIEPLNLLAGNSNYYVAPDPKTWLTGIPNYGRLQYQQVYPGIDLLFYGNRGRLEYDFTVSPGANPDLIALQLPSDCNAAVTAAGDLGITCGKAQLQLLKPVIFQSGAGGARRPIEGGYKILAGDRGPQVKFTLGTYDPMRPLVIDPVLTFSQPITGLSGIHGMRVDPSGHIYIAGQNSSSAALEITKISSDGTTVLYSTSLGSSWPQVDGIAVDSSGRAYVAAYAGSGFPTTATAYQASISSGNHVYFVALDAAGSLNYATYVAGSSADYPEGIAADPTGKAYVFGETCSTDFPRTIGSTPISCYSPFVLKFDPSLSGAASLVYSNILGTTNAYALEGGVDASNNLYVAVQVNGGSPLSTTPGAANYQGSGAPYGSYVEKLDVNGNTQYVAYLGPGNPYAITVEGSGAVYVAGTADAYDYPTTPGSFDTSYPGAVLSKLSPDGSTLVYSTFIAGPSGTLSNTVATGLAVPAGCATNCNVFFGGYTSTRDLPVSSPIQSANLTTSSYTGFLGQMNASGSQPVFLSYLGGSQYYATSNCADDSSCAPYVDSDTNGNLYVAGFDYSNDFPLTTGTNSSYYYLAKISPNNSALALSIPGSITFPYSQPVGIATDHVPQTNTNLYPNQVMQFRNLGSSPITISGVNVAGADFSETDDCGTGLPAGGICHIQVQFDPIQSGTRSGTLTINSSAPNGPTVISLTGTAYDTPVQQWSTAELDFGGVNVNTTSTAQTVTLTNLGNTAMTIYSFYLSGPFAQTNNCPGTLLPGTSCTVSVTFKPVNIGYVTNGYIVVSASGYYLSSSEIVLTGTGTGVGTSNLLVSPTSLNFPTTLLGSVSPTNNDYNIALQNTGTVPLTINSVGITGDFNISSMGCGSLPRSLAPQQQCYLRVQFAPTVTGTRSGTLTITSTDSTVPQTVSLSGNGITGSSSLSLNSYSLAWPDQPVGTISSSFGENQTLQFTNTGLLPVMIYRIYDDLGDFHIVSDYCSGSQIAVGSSCSISIEFVPTQVGPRTGSVIIINSAAASPLTVALSGNALTPTQVAVLSPTNPSFADQVINTTSNGQYVYLYNYGNVPLTITSVQNSNPSEFAITSAGCNSNTTVPAGSSCGVYVQFTPSQAGARSAYLSFNDSAPGSPHVALLTGLGLNPTGSLEINPTSIPFGNEAVTTSTSTVSVLVRNLGNSVVNLTGVSSSLPDYVISSNSCTGTISAGSYCYFYVAFDPTTTGARNGTITVSSSNATSQGVNVTGTGVTATKALAVIAPATMDLGPVVLNNSQQRSFYIRNIGTQTVNLSGVTGLSAPFTASNNCGSTIAINTSCLIYVNFRPTATGTPSQTLSINSDATGSPQTLTVKGTGVSAQSGLVFQTNGLQFDQATTGSTDTSGQQYLYLYNYSGSAVTYGTPTIGSGFTLGSSNCPTGGSVGNGGGCYYYVQESPVATGLYTANLTINIQGANFSAQMTGYGVSPQPAVSLSQDGMLFPDQVVGNTSNVQYVYVTNVGNTPVTFTPSALTTGTDFSIQYDQCFGTYGSNNALPPNANCYVGVQFGPASAGSKIDTLTINDSTGGHTVTLNGIGMTPVSLGEVQPSGISFPDTTVGLTAYQEYVYYYNTGNVTVSFSSNPQVCTTTGDPCTTSPDFALGTSGGSCSSTSSLPPGYSCYQYVQFAPQSAGAKTAVLRFNDSANGAPHYVQLSGNGVSARTSIIANKTTWSFPDTPLGATSNTDYIYVTNAGNTPVTFTAANSSSTEFPLSNNACAYYFSGTPMQPGAQCYIGITFTPSGTAGVRNATLSISTSAGTMSIALNANATTGVTTLQVEATQLNFGQVPVGVQANQYLYLTNTGNLPVNLGTPTVAPTGEVTVSGCPATLQPLQTCYIYVYMTPSAAGPRSATITYNDNATGNPHVITVNATGISNTVSLSQTNVDFGSVAVAVQSPLVTVYYVNQTSATITISSVTVGGTNAGDFTLYNNSCSGSVGSASYCYFNAYFKPTAAGTRSANITVVDSTGTNQVVNLTGTGVNPFPVASIFPSQLTFAPQNFNTTSPSQAITVTNTGSANLTFSSFTLQQSSTDFAVVSNSCQGATVAPNQNCSIALTFTPAGGATRSATLSIADSAASSPQVINITGDGQSVADLAVTGSVSPQFGSPGLTATYSITVTDLGPSASTGVTLTITAPTNATVQSITPSAGTCSGTSVVTCSIGNLAVNGSATVTMVATNTVAGSMTTSISATENESDSVTTNNTLTLNSDTSGADLQVIASPTMTQYSNEPAATVTVLNGGPGNATGVTATFDLDRFGYVTSTSSQGSCSWNGVQVICSIGSLNNGASATVMIAVTPPDANWASIQAHATANQYDNNPVNNLVQFTPTPEGYNTALGSNISVNTQDSVTRAAGNVLFAKVTRPGNTAMTAANGAPPPAGYRAARSNQAFDVTTSAQFSGAVTFTLQFPPAAFWHPAEARLFHNENGAWVDRTSSINPAGTIIASVASLSQFAVFEPPDQPPTANPGTAMIAAGTNPTANQVQLNAALSSDPEKDALTYKWTGPFPEGNGTVTGINPTVTLPIGTSQVTLVVNDGEVDSAPVTQNVTFSDFTLAVNNANVALTRGSSATINIALAPKFAAYDGTVTLECANLPADLSCQFAQSSASPGTNGAAVALTITSAPTSAAVSHQNSSRTRAAWLLAFGLPFGIVVVASDRRRRVAKLALLLMLALVLYLAGCGGGGGSLSPTPTPSNSSTTSSVITVTATSGGLQHSIAVNVTRN